MKKYCKFFRSIVASTPAFLGGGLIGSKLASYLTDSAALISLSSTAGEAVFGYPTLLYLHKENNPDLYEKEGKTKEFIKDALKLYAGLSLLDLGYYMSRGYLSYRFQKQGYSPESSSLMADGICLPVYWGLSVGVGKLTGVIRNEK